MKTTTKKLDLELENANLKRDNHKITHVQKRKKKVE